MAVEKKSTEHIIDTAIGPMSVKQTTVVGFDIDNFVQGTVDSQATYLRMLLLMDNAKPTFTKDRPPVRLGGKEVGGYE